MLLFWVPSRFMLLTDCWEECCLSDTVKVGLLVRSSLMGPSCSWPGCGASDQVAGLITDVVNDEKVGKTGGALKEFD